MTATTEQSALIVVGVDGSPLGTVALAWALSEARLRSVRLLAVHAWRVPPLSRPSLTPSGLKRISENLRASAEVMLQGELERQGEAFTDIEVEPLVLNDHPAEALLGAAAGAMLLVVGSRGHRGIVGALLGSVSQQCVHRAPCPIAVVHAAHHGDRRRIVVGVDGSPGARVALDWAADEAFRRTTSLHAVCAYNEPPGLIAAGPTSAGAIAELQRGLVCTAETVLESAEESVAKVGISTEAVHGSAADALLSAASDAELLVVGSRGGGFTRLLVGSVSQHCAARAAGVVVVVPFHAAKVG
jgi:nucleotide-binding universal stress UspA family protein